MKWLRLGWVSVDRQAMECGKRSFCSCSSDGKSGKYSCEFIHFSEKHFAVANSFQKICNGVKICNDTNVLWLLSL